MLWLIVENVRGIFLWKCNWWIFSCDQAALWMVQSVWDQRNEEISVRTLFHRKAKKRKKRSRRSPHIPTKTAEHIYDLITGTLPKRNTPDHNPEQLNNAIITAQKIIPQMNKAELKKIGGMAHEDTIKDCNIPLRLLHIIIDLTAAKLPVKTDEKPQASKQEDRTCFYKKICQPLDR